MVLFITIRSFVIGAIVTVYNHAIGPCNLFQKCNLFHHNCFCRHATGEWHISGAFKPVALALGM